MDGSHIYPMKGKFYSGGRGCGNKGQSSRRGWQVLQDDDDNRYMKWGKQNICPTNQNYQAQRKQGGCLQNENVQENIKIGNYGGN